MSALACALAVAAPSEARERYLGEHHAYRHEAYRHPGYGWGDRGDYRRHRWHHHHHHYAPRHYYHHRHYRGCGHAGYYHGFHDGALVGFLVDYARYD
ncbi:MAG: hypothetical protein PHC73_11320 [Immundisolibacter sp.]|nr:hypothetical protein [Immundisolibacter sp.]